MVEILVTILVIINILVFFYFLFVNGSYITLIIMAYFQTKKSRQKEDLFELSGLFGTNLYRSISILAPAYNEEKSIIESTRALLNLQFSDYEVIIINDGSTDKTLEKLIKDFELKEIDRHIPDLLKSKDKKSVRFTKIP